MKYKARKPGTIPLSIIISRNTGGIWKFNMIINVLEPEVDDTIHIYSKVNEIATVNFKFNNIDNESLPFSAFFTCDSDLEFSISP